MRKTRLRTLCLCLLVAGCSGVRSDTSTSLASNARGQSNKVTPEKGNRSADDLRGQLEKIVVAAHGRVGVAATVLESGESVAINGHGQFPMQSVYKFPIGMAVLDQVDRGKLKLEQRVLVGKSDFVRAGQHSPIRDRNLNGTKLSVRELLRFMVSESDGTACDVLLGLIGGPKIVAEYLQGLNVKDVIVANTEKEIGQDWSTQYRNWASPEGAVALLRALHEGRGLSEQSRALLLKLMTETPTGLRRLKGLLPAGAVVAHKTGSSGTADGVTAATNDVGLMTLPGGRHIAVAVFVSDSKADASAREEVIAKVGRAAWSYWGR